MIWSKRPGTGIPSYRMKEVIGKYAANDIAECAAEGRGFQVGSEVYDEE